MAGPVGAPRRIGAPDATNRARLLDAAEQLMLAEGYAAVTSRRVAAQAGLKPQLVHYYFRAMDDLFAAMFRRRAEQGLALQAQALQSPTPLRALWRFTTDPAGARLTLEFMALANHRKALRAEIAHYGERARREQTRAMVAALQRYGVAASEVPPVVWTVFATGISSVLVMESEIGVATGHDETLAFVERWLCRLEGGLEGGEMPADAG
ncbi:TetR/AcrR family transcriptional regulator [Mycobacterium sp. MYCO198283]|uniref:TetR/AcrR family transcriptional regulator n=1 Tax=Mycobacterium sp. MYCO198283 TaxID=2883505 RepID=UPI001E386538|nr:TetR/AcrR family transcriptional regulator [Mycobacterium sp. MYCO198283]MCG5434258.1 TetR/AcrR family transcriptional regulator [Mycobacterium sp. MYCO198283]